MPLSIATWNVNSLRMRLSQLGDWLRAKPHDIVLLQEIKMENGAFPHQEIEDLGYNVAVHGQKTYNGVAILSRLPLSDICTALPGDTGDTEARYIEAVASGQGAALRLASIYVPNGQSPDSEKFAYKLRFLNRLHDHAQNLLRYREVLVWGGDYNVAPDPLDVYAPKALEGSICFHPQERMALRRLLHLGMYDAYRSLHPTTQAFSWWDYRGNGFDTGKGMRIDHLLLSPQALDLLESCEIDIRLRGQEKPSDHAPVSCTLRYTPTA